MFKKRFFSSWIFSAFTMFMLSLFWHGAVLSDFSNLTYPLRTFVFFAAIFYLVIGFLVTKMFSLPYLVTKYEKLPLRRGAAGGAIIGVALFLISAIIGISFNSQFSFKHLLYDSLWQVIEEGMGGIVVGITHIFVYDTD